MVGETCNSVRASSLLRAGSLFCPVRDVIGMAGMGFVPFHGAGGNDSSV